MLDIEVASSMKKYDSPEKVADGIGDLTDDWIPDKVYSPKQVTKKVMDWLGADDLPEYEAVGSDNIKQTVTLLPTDNPNARRAPLDPTTLSFQLATDDLPLTAGSIYIDGDEEKSIPAPFSLYYPTVAWPFMTDEGKRYTVIDLGNEPIDFPGRDWVGLLLRRKLDKVAALPGFRGWGDPLLGVGAVAPLVVVAIPVVYFAPLWGPSLAATGVKLGKTVWTQGLQFVNSVRKAAGDIAESFVKEVDFTQ